jgi:hypothetical protein
MRNHNLKAHGIGNKNCHVYLYNLKFQLACLLAELVSTVSGRLVSRSLTPPFYKIVERDISPF